MTEPAESPAPAPEPARVRVWDAPTRLFHWAIVLLIPALWWTAENGRITLHQTLGLTMLALILFRILWGFMGSSTARFGAFVKGPAGIARYLGGRAGHVVGHNPLGALSVMAMLLLLVVQVGLGLFAIDEDGLYPGPFSSWVSVATADRLTENHGTVFNIILAMIVLHVAAILVYAVRGRNLVGPMVSGHGAAPEGAAPMVRAPAWRLVVALLIAIGAAFWLYTRL